MTSWDSIRFTQTKTQQTFSPNTSQQKHSTDTCKQLGSTPSTTSTREWIQQQQFHNTRAANALCARVHNCVSKQCTHRHTHTRTRLSHDRCHQQTLMNISLVSFHPVFQQDLFWNPNMVIYFDYQHQHHWLSQHDFLFCRMTYFNKILPNVKVNMSCDAWWCQHRLLTTVVYSTFFCAAIFVSTELLTQQLWALNREQGFLDIFNMLSWSNNFIWSYNTPVILATVGDEIPQHLIYMLQQAIQYGGTQQLEFLPEAARTKIRMVLNKWHPLLEGGQQFQYFGVKTPERLRGSSTLATWLMEQSTDEHLQQHFDEVNKYRAPTGMEDNMEENDAEWSTMITTGMELRQHPGAEAPKQQSPAQHDAQHMRAWSAHN